MHAHGNDREEKFQNVPRVRTVLVRVVEDAAVLVLDDSVAVHDPFDRRFAVDDVFVRDLRNVADGNVRIDDDRVFQLFVQEEHFLDTEIIAPDVHENFRKFGLRLVIEMKLGKLTAGAGVRPEFTPSDKRETRKHLFQVRRELRPVIRVVKVSVDKVENVLFPDTRIHAVRAKPLQNTVRHAVMANVPVLRLGKHIRLLG